MRPPVFWKNPPDAPGWQAHALAPLGCLYARATAKRLRRDGLKLPVPIICVGNINVGGTGKTPTALALIALLQARGAVVHVVSRGYGGTLLGPVQVNPAHHTAAEVGDEPILLALQAPTWVARDRAAGANAAAAAGASVIILDDGFQNPAVHKDLSLVVVDAAAGFGNARPLPAGPLRETLSAGLARADLVLTIGPDVAQTRFATPLPCPRLQGQLVPLETGMPWQGLRTFAFAGIGNPAKFFTSLESLGATIVGREGLDDHQPLSDALMTRLAAQARALNARLVTTEKDAIRLPDHWRAEVLVLPVRLHIRDESPLIAALDKLSL
ncbi:tetraacyldisaccharide 4'-kinase [Ketogulonicigenium robustum]|uniref:Tetraacyldisaccharide 4'-kinase n=1 Tax=Ketogulonicigenium robustum TaxID=92947 RepID=A0A1W6P2U6_9RHOB|nr:tetraacyldisaccharide 4'-kinase [Ketogulonicigenium robustum]ARO15743.1 tetraacyldisaccharide 4'-kinase [Ketogulonicigenium robustum]